MTKKLQVALDLTRAEDALSVLEKVARFVDIIELGTPLLIAEGARIIRIVKEKYPDKTIFADVKVMDGGSVIPKICFEAGADMVSVLAVAEDETIEATINMAKQYDAKVLVDMCSVKDIASRGRQIAAMKPALLCVHVGYDIQATGIDPIKEIKKLDGIKIDKAIAGGINLDTFAAAVNSPADVIISGAGIYNQENMEEVASEMRSILDDYNHLS